MIKMNHSLYFSAFLITTGIYLLYPCWFTARLGDFVQIFWLFYWFEEKDWQFKKIFKQKIRIIKNLEVTSISLNMDGNFGVGGTHKDSEEKWIDRDWWKKFKRRFWWAR